MVACGHGHAFARPDGSSSCACAYGYEGARCDIDALASCSAERQAADAVLHAQGNVAKTISVRTFRFGWHNASWTCDLLVLLDERQITCACLAACASYIERIHELISTASGTGFSHRIALRSLPQCAQGSMYSEVGANFTERLRASLDEPVSTRTRMQLLSEETHVSTTNCITNCSGRGTCRGHFCECDAGTIGANCRRRTRLEARRHPLDAELRIQLLESVPAAALYEQAGRHAAVRRGVVNFGSGALLDKRAVYWAQSYFYAHLARDVYSGVLVDAGARMLLAIDSGLSMDVATAERWAGRSFDWVVLLTTLPSDVPRAPSQPRGIRMHPHCPRPPADTHRPPNGAFDPRRDVCVPPNDPTASMGIDDFHALPPEELPMPHSTTRSKLAAPQPLPNRAAAATSTVFDAQSKDLYDVFFVGKVGGEGPQCNRTCTDSLQTLLAAQARDRRACSGCYSGGMRQWFYRFWHGKPRMLIAPSLSRAVPWDAQARSKYCLVAGGVGFDMRLTSSVLRGCVPLWTNMRVAPPLFRVWRHERLMLLFQDSAHDRARLAKLANLPAFLACYEGARPSLLANLRDAWPALVWGPNGTAYEHTLLEIANVTGSLASGALSRVLAVHGPRYVAEVSRLPLDVYDASKIPGLADARALRTELRRVDPLGDQLESAEACAGPR